jgi:membrane-bound inhibitor of C-type lysozyme
MRMDSGPEKRTGILGSFDGVSEYLLKNNTRANALIIILVLLTAVPLLGVGMLATRPFAPPAAPAVVNQGVAAAGEFFCAGQKFLTAVFSNDRVQLTLSDGREIDLPQALSAIAAARYANSDGSFVFLNQGGTASVAENGATTYSGCVSLGN